MGHFLLDSALKVVENDIITINYNTKLTFIDLLKEKYFIKEWNLYRMVIYIGFPLYRSGIYIGFPIDRSGIYIVW